MTGPFPVGGHPRLTCLVVADEAALADWVAGLSAAGWQVLGVVPAGPTAPGVTAPGATAPGAMAPGTMAPGTTAPGATVAGGPALLGRRFSGLDEALSRTRPHAVAVGRGEPGAAWPSEALAGAVHRGLHALGPSTALAGAGSAEALRRAARRAGAVVLVDGAPTGPGSPARVRVLGEALRHLVLRTAPPPPLPSDTAVLDEGAVQTEQDGGG